jgi:hypothetical protein
MPTGLRAPVAPPGDPTGGRVRPPGAPTTGDAAVSRVAQELVAHALFQEAARALDGAGIPVMPLKGVLLARWVYAPGDRISGDVDLLVPAPHFETAQRALAAAGFRVRRNTLNPREASCVAPGFPMEVDLHGDLFGPGRYRLHASDLFARGKQDSALFGVPVVLPDPLDALAHVVGHAASDHTPETAQTARRDAERLAARFGIAAAACAARLEESGLGRAARYAFGLWSRDLPFARAVLGALGPDTLGDALAGLARSLASRFDPGSPFGVLAGHMTNTTLPQVAAAILKAARLRLTGACR